MKISYKELFKNAYKLTWKYKYLWIFGLFASIFNNLELINFIDQKGARIQVIDIWITISSLFSWSSISTLFALSPIDFTFAILTMLAIILIAIIFIWLSITSQISIIANIQKISTRKKPSFYSSIKESKGKFWNVFGLNLSAKLIIMILAIGFAIPSITSFLLSNEYTVIISKIFSILLIILFLFLSIITYFIFLYAIIFYVIRKYTFKKSIKMALNLFSKNWLISIEIAILLFIITLIIGQISLVGTKILLITLLVILATLNTWFGYFAGLIIVILILLLIGILVGAVTTFQIAVWTLLFEKLTGKQYHSKIGALIGKIKK